VISIDTDREAPGPGTRLSRTGRGRGAGRADRGKALEVLPTFRSIDLAYVDAVKTEYRRYLDLLLPRVRVSGLLVSDHLLWKGHVAEPPEEDDANAATPCAPSRLPPHPPPAARLPPPLGDGVGLATKTKPLVSEMGGPSRYGLRRVPRLRLAARSARRRQARRTRRSDLRRRRQRLGEPPPHLFRRRFISRALPGAAPGAVEAPRKNWRGPIESGRSVVVRHPPLADALQGLPSCPCRRRACAPGCTP